jgi:hypothetical protein
MFFLNRQKIKIAPALFQRLQNAAAQAGYASMDELVEHALEQAVERIEVETTRQHASDKNQIDQQLRGLGYLE